MTVQTIPAIEDMTPTQKIELMEALWANMREEVEKSPPPGWHLRILEEREKALANGDDEFIDWNDAKDYILKETSGPRK